MKTCSELLKVLNLSSTHIRSTSIIGTSSMGRTIHSSSTQGTNKEPQITESNVASHSIEHLVVLFYERYDRQNSDIQRL